MAAVQLANTLSNMLQSFDISIPKQDAEPDEKRQRAPIIHLDKITPLLTSHSRNSALHILIPVLPPAYKPLRRAFSAVSFFETSSKILSWDEKDYRMLCSDIQYVFLLRFLVLPPSVEQKFQLWRYFHSAIFPELFDSNRENLLHTITSIWLNICST